MNECEYKQKVKYGYLKYYCSLFGIECFNDDKSKCESYNKAKEIERINHFCDDKPENIEIILIENSNLPYGWYQKLYIRDPEEGWKYNYIKIRYCPFCGKKLLL